MNNELILDLINELWDKVEELNKTPLHSLQAKIKDIEYDVQDLYRIVNEVKNEN